MRARELAVEFPTVTPDSSAAEAARLLAENGLPGLIVVDERHRPKAVLPGTQLLRLVIPHYVRDAPTLAYVYDEGHADRLGAHLADKSVADLLERTPVLVVDAEATAMEIASMMARAKAPSSPSATMHATTMHPSSASSPSRNSSPGSSHSPTRTEATREDGGGARAVSEVRSVWSAGFSLIQGWLAVI